MKQVEELKALATRQDDSWMDSMSTEELKSLSKRVRTVAEGLSGLQSRLQGSVPGKPSPTLIPNRAAAGSLGSMVRKDVGAPGPAAGPARGASPAGPPRPSPFPGFAGGDMSNPMQRRRVGG